MALLSRGRKKRLVLDIGTSAIRMCELGQTKTGYQLVKYYQKEFNSDPALEDEARKDLRKKALQELLKEAKVRTRKSIFAVPGQSVFTRTRTLPPVPEYKVNQIVKYEIQQQIPFGLDQVAMSYQILNRTEAGGYEVMMAAIKVDVVDKHLEVLESARRSVDTVDVSPLAAYNWLKHTGEFGDQGECVALIDLGATTTDIIIERENQFRFTRPLNVGGNDVTQAIASGLGMNFVEAERLKRERGFAPTGDPQRDGKGGELIGQALQRLVGEIMRSFAYFRSLPGGGPVSKVILTGGGAGMRNIIPYMQRQLGVEVRIAQPLAGLAVGPAAQPVSDHPEQAAVALGLALRCWQTATIEVNLIPPRVLERARRKEQVFYWALSLATLALIMASIIPVSANENKVVQGRILQLKQAIGLYDPELPGMIQPGNAVPDSQYARDLKQVKGEVQTLQENVKMLDNVRRGRTFWLPQILMISGARPTTGGIWFSSLQTSNIQLPGESPAGASPTQFVAVAASGGATRPGERDESGRRRPRFVSQRASQGPQSMVRSTGFPGTSGGGGRAAGGRVGAGGVSLGMSRRDEEDDTGQVVGGMAGGTGQQAPLIGAGGFADDDPAPEFPEPNGFIVNGFAEKDELIREFIENLKQEERQLPSGLWTRVIGVDFNEATVQRWDRSILYNAPADVENLPPAPALPYTPNYDNSVYSFVVHVKFVRSETKGGDALPEAPMPTAGAGVGAPAGAAPIFGSGGGGLQGLQKLSAPGGTLGSSGGEE